MNEEKSNEISKEEEREIIKMVNELREKLTNLDDVDREKGKKWVKTVMTDGLFYLSNNSYNNIELVIAFIKKMTDLKNTLEEVQSHTVTSDVLFLLYETGLVYRSAVVKLNPSASPSSFYNVLDKLKKRNMIYALDKEELLEHKKWVSRYRSFVTNNSKAGETQSKEIVFYRTFGLPGLKNKGKNRVLKLERKGHT